MLPTQDSPLLEHLAKIQKAMLKRDAKLLNEVTREYALAYKRLRADIDALLKIVKEGGELTSGQILQLNVTRNLLNGVKAEMDRFTKILAGKMKKSVLDEINAAGVDSFGLVQKSLPGAIARITGTWTRLAPRQVYTLFGFLDPDGPLYANMQAKFGEALAAKLRDDLMTGFITGMNPRTIARLISKSLGVGLDWALTTARTANLWAYRMASHQNYVNNSDVVKAWMWYAQLDDRVCMSCIVQHGKTHSLAEVLNDHHCGRCTELPITTTYAELGITGVPEEKLNVQTGVSWFTSLPEAKQRQIMGPAKWNAWANGEITLDQLSRIKFDKIYGQMRVEASLKSILPDKAQLFYE